MNPQATPTSVPARPRASGVAAALAGVAFAGACLVAASPCLAQNALAEPTPTVRSLQFGNPTLGLPLSSRARLVYEPRPSRPWAESSPAALAGAPAEDKLGLEFKTVSATSGAKNLLRVQLSASSALQFRPRGGGLNVSYRAQF